METILKLSDGLLDSNLPPNMYPIDDDIEKIEENN